MGVCVKSMLSSLCTWQRGAGRENGRQREVVSLPLEPGFPAKASVGGRCRAEGQRGVRCTYAYGAMGLCARPGQLLWVCVRAPGSEHVKVEERAYLYVWAPYVCACVYGEVGM